MDGMLSRDKFCKRLISAYVLFTVLTYLCHKRATSKAWVSSGPILCCEGCGVQGLPSLSSTISKANSRFGVSVSGVSVNNTWGTWGGHECGDS